MLLKDAEKYVLNYKNYKRLFGKKLISPAIEQMDIHDFMMFRCAAAGSKDDRIFRWEKRYPLVRRHIPTQFKLSDGTIQQQKANEYLTPESEQNEERTILKNILLLRFPYLSEFTFPTYHLHEYGNEIYVRCENGKDLYVPLDALFKGDWEMVVKHTTKYWKCFYSKPEDQKQLQEQLTVFDTETAQKLKTYLSEKKGR